MFKSGFVTVVGRPNVGKSTLLNQVIGEKISIISDKPQTTRNKIQMIYTDDKMQVVFLDNPGIQDPKNALGEYMLGVSKSTLEEVDVITFMVEMGEVMGRVDSEIFSMLKDLETPVILLVNKIDLFPESEVEEVLDKYRSMDFFTQVIPTSAENSQLGSYLEAIYENLEEGPMYYPEDMITDQPERNIIQELIREKALVNMDEEIPHGIAVEIEKISKREDRDLLDVDATIFVEKKSHKPMVIGKGGQMIKKIGMEARVDIERLMDTKVNLQLWVKVAENWRKKEKEVRGFGYS